MRVAWVRREVHRDGGSGGQACGRSVVGSGVRREVHQVVGVRRAGASCGGGQAGVRREVVRLQAVWVRVEVRQDAGGEGQACGA
jgi:hypothetical protein